MPSPEASIAVAHDELARSGLYVEPTSATAAALLERLIGDGTIGGTDKVVVILTGSGLKAGELIARMLKEAAVGTDDGAQEILRAPLRRRVEKARGRCVFDDLAAIDEADAIGKFPRKTHLMRHHQDSQVAFRGEHANNIEDLADEFRIERGGHLVEEQNFRIHGKCPRNGDALLLPAG